MREKDERTLKLKLSHTDDDLLEEIGADLSQTEGFDLSAMKPDELRRRAERWLESQEGNFVRKICKEWKFS